jgi:hypothetical protein
MPGIDDQLRQLAELHASGELTEEEFMVAKKEILSAPRRRGRGWLVPVAVLGVGLKRPGSGGGSSL